MPDEEIEYYIDEAYFLTKISQNELDIIKEGVEGSLTSSIAAAQDRVNGALRKQTTDIPLPPDKVTDSIKQYTYYLAIYFAYDRPSFDDIPKRVVDNYDIAIDWMKDVQANRLDLNLLVEEEKRAKPFETIDGQDEGIMNNGVF